MALKARWMQGKGSNRVRERATRNTLAVIIEVQRAAGSNEQLCWVACHTNQSPGKRKPQARSCLHQFSLWPSLWGVSKTEDWCRRAQLSADGAISAWVVMEGIRKQAEKGSKQDFSMVSASRQFGSQLHPSLSKLLLANVSAQPKKANWDSCVLN